jgi:D-alanine-D-alanine ligase
MKIGITYDLRDDYLAEGYSEEQTAEFDKPETIEAIDRTIQDLGHQTVQIGRLQSLVRLLAAGDRWDLVFNIAEGLRGFGREAAVPAVLDAYNIPYTFSDPLVLCLALHKAMTKRVIRDLGIPTPNFLVIETTADIENVNLRFPVFAKPVAEGTGKGISAQSRISGKEELLSVCQNLILQFGQPVLVESFLPGREFTVGIVGTGKDARAIGVMEVMLNERAEPGAYSYDNKAQYEERVQYRLMHDTAAQKAADTALAAWRGLGCRDGGRIDLREDASGMPHFIEVNPLAGLHPVHSDLPIICRLAGIPYRELLDMILQSACKRAAGYYVSNNL